MSLINDALKKAQKQRTGDGPDLNTMPAIGGQSAARIARRDKPAGFNTLVLWIGIGVAALVLLGVGGFFAVHLLTQKPDASSASKTASAPAAAPKTDGVTPATTAATVNPPATNPAATVATTPPAASATTPAVVIPAPVHVAEIKPVVVVPVTPAPEPEAPKLVLPAPKMDSKGIIFIEALKVTGIRASATDSKVLMNDRVYRVGDIVEHQMEIKITAITSSSLSFEDEKGARYTRNF